ncbi:MAG: hypothetical protein V4622_01055 [Bacteroidota bacterium]
MKFYHLILCILFYSISFSQSNTNNSNTNEPQIQNVGTLKKEQSLDSLSRYKTKESKSKLDKTTKKSKTPSKTKEIKEEEKTIQEKPVSSESKSLEEFKIMDLESEGDLKNDLDQNAVQPQEKTNQQLGSSFMQVKVAASTQTTQRSATIEQQVEMQEILNDYQQSAPNSFEYHYFKYVSGNYNVDLIGELNQAYKLKPKSTEVQIQYAAFNFIKNDEKNLKKNLENLLEAKKIDAEVLLYSENLLESVCQNGVLLTHGFDDTYSTLYVQKNKNKRSDVQIISLDFMQSDYYKNSLKSLGYKIPIAQVIDVDFFKSFCELNADKKLQISMTFPKPYLKAISDKISVLGLSMIYNENIVNLAGKNEEIYKKIDNSNALDSYTTEKAKKLSSNYLPMLLSLKKEYESDSYRLKENNDKIKALDIDIEKIKKQANIQKSLKSYK